VAHLEEVCMRDYATALWGQWRPRPAEDFRAERHRIIVGDDTDVGCIETIIQADHLRLGKLYLLPDYRRRGWGAEILSRIVTEAHSLNLPLRLSVLTTNPAQAFYRREGLSLIAQDNERLTFES
jgi:GNAT superfamily N-acetyltransferase